MRQSQLTDWLFRMTNFANLLKAVIKHLARNKGQSEVGGY